MNESSTDFHSGGMVIAGVCKSAFSFVSLFLFIFKLATKLKHLTFFFFFSYLVNINREENVHLNAVVFSQNL